MNESTGDDHIVRVLAKEAGVLAMACSAKSVVQEAARRHDCLAGRLRQHWAMACLLRR